LFLIFDQINCNYPTRIEIMIHKDTVQFFYFQDPLYLLG